MQEYKITYQEDFIETIRFYKETLDAHNELRAFHNVPDLCLNLKLCKIAQDRAVKYANNSSITSEESSFYDDTLGENNAFQFSHSQDAINGLVITRIWYNEIKYYNFSDPKFLPTTGHFSQIVWNNTTDVGFGRSRGKDGSYYMVAKYFPAGNIPGDFKDNVKR
jgi:uncharacterized protein YkwD